MASFPPIRELIPHAGRMILLDELLEWEEGRARAKMRIRERMPFVRSKRMSTIALMEPMAQAVAACLGYEAYRGGAGVRVGMIIGARSFEIFRAELAVGDALTFDVERIRGSESLSHFSCKAWREGEKIAEATLTLFHAEKPPE
ncbi:MAG: hypothetical protein GX614_11510 [Sandaracinaceae bacterium]|nr:hypothetical protein [Sandaracinaceae bacterium]